MTILFSSCAKADADANIPLIPLETVGGDESVYPVTDVRDELRGVFIATAYNIDFPSKAGLSGEKLAKELDEIVYTVKKSGLNAIFFQVRPSSDAMYSSSLFPVSEFLTGRTDGELPDGFDPLYYLIETAHSEGIEVHAWINPLRITRGGTLFNPKTDVESLSEKHPARLSPHLAVPYAGELYYDPGMPETRALVAAGITEIVENYDVDGIIFDDYFYPYPEEDADGNEIAFDDSSSYELYGKGKDRDEYRRDNINKLVKMCYNAVKAVDITCTFGIAPFGIWQNDNGKNGGSETSGLEAYSEIYCDALAWIEGGYVDYIAPQIYWNFSKESASYRVLSNWWNKKLDGSGVDLYISHAAYKYGTDEWGEADIVDEMTAQIEYARGLISYRGSIFYGYEQLSENVSDLQTETVNAYKNAIAYTAPIKTGQNVKIVFPEENTLTQDHAVTLVGISDPSVTVTFNGEKLSRDKNGRFRLDVILSDGDNYFEFYSKYGKYVYMITKATDNE